MKSAPKPVLPLEKILDFKQDNNTYKIKLSQNSNIVIFSIKDLNRIDEFYELEILFEDIQKKNQIFKIYNSIEDLITSIEKMIQNKNISLTKNTNGLILDLFIYNIVDGNKEKVSFQLNKIENTNKDEIIKSLSLKVNILEEKYNELNEKYEDLEKKYEKIMSFIGPMIKKKEEEKDLYKFQWEYHENCEYSNNNKILKKLKIMDGIQILKEIKF